MVHEPTTSAFVVTGFIAAALGPVLGPFALLLFGAVAGSLLAMSKETISTRWEGVRFVAVGVVIALAITGLCVWLVERYTPVPGNLALMPVACAIGAGRSHLLALMDKGVEVLGNFLTALAGGARR